MRYDLIIRGGTIIDGTMRPRYAADIGIRAGVIEKIGAIQDASADTIIEAAGLTVCPGFIDPHTHYDAQVFWDPTCADSGENGTTTVIAGNCGFGFAPCRPNDRDRYMKMMTTTEQIPLTQMQTALPWSWETYPQLLDAIDEAPKAVNVAMYMPLNPLLCYVMGVDAAKTRRPTPEEMATLKGLVSEGLDNGAIGISLVRLGATDSHTDFDGSPMPTDMMDPHDAAELASELGRRGRGVVMCMSQIGDGGDREVSEIIMRSAGRPLIHNLLVTNETHPEMHRRDLAWLDEMNASGATVYGQGQIARNWQEYTFWTAEAQPLDFTETARELTMCKTSEGKLAKAADEDFRRRLKADFDPAIMEVLGGLLDNYTVLSMGPGGDPKGYEGLTFGEIARRNRTTVIDTYLDLAIESNLGMTYQTPPPAADPVLAAELISHPKVLAGVSDGGAHSKIFSGGFWTTDLLVRLVREHGLLDQETAHNILSHRPSQAFGLSNRGSIEEGNAADIVIYDLEELYVDDSSYDVVSDMPGGDWRRHARAGGYRWILVNGEISYAGGARTETASGKLLRASEGETSSPPRPRRAADGCRPLSQ